MNRNIILGCITLAAFSLGSCEDFLDKEPLSLVVPTEYYKDEAQIQAAVNKLYTEVLPSHTNWSFGIFGLDSGTDNQVGFNPDVKYAKGQWKVALENDNWNWENIHNINYSLKQSLTNYNNKEVTGSEKNIRQYIGELYFLRAYAYFTMLQKWGDLPIVKEDLPLDEEYLIEMNKRSPRNEVARFILEDLGHAVEYMSDNFDTRKNRISPDVAKLLKSRVALFEASWLENFKGTAFVPNGEGWPGKSKDYNASYEYPLGTIDKEIEFFLEEAVASAEIVAEKYKNSLTQNTGKVPQSEEDPDNPYISMFGNTDMSTYPDVLLWREYSKGLGVVNNVEVGIQHGNNGVGLTRSMVESFVMKDGKPHYASHTGFVYDDETLAKIRENADPRLHIFLKEPDQKNLFKNMTSQETHGVEVEPYPDITNMNAEKGYSTGYTIRKGGTFDKDLCGNGNGYTGAVVFRATEALLNYMEAQYLLTRDLNSGKIMEYWKLIREAAGFEGTAVNPTTMIDATEMDKEVLDWGAYTAGTLLQDKVLYNIRRERRCELMAEGLRWMDLLRWRAMDQMITTPYHVEGFHLWNTSMQNWYEAEDLVDDGSSSATVSNVSLGEYLRPFEKNMTSGNLYRDGFVWSMAHYLEPLPIKQFQLTSSDRVTVEQSILYQNPYWPLKADSPAEK